MRASIFFRALIVVSLFALASCKEEPPYINFEPPKSTVDETYVDSIIDAPEPKEVLLEDVTGVRCPNCPAAAIIAKDLLTLHNGKLNVIAMQPKNFNSLLTRPFVVADGDHYDTRFDYRTAACIAICELVSKPNTLPSGYVDRKVFATKTDPILAKEDWGERVGQQVNFPSPVNIKLSAKHVAAENKIVVDVTVKYTSTIPAGKSHNLSIALTQDSTIDVQENGSNYDSAYVSMHLLRDMMTAYTGDALTAKLVAGRVFVKRYEYVIPAPSFTFAPFVIRNMHVVAFVHEDAASGKQVIQSKEVHITE